MRWSIIILIILSAFSDWALILPAERLGPWTRSNVGVEGGIPNSSNMTVNATISAGASLTTINNALAACPSNRVVQLSNGSYTLNGNVVVPNGVVLRGEGTNTLLFFNPSGGIIAGGTTWANMINGSAPFGTATVTAGCTPGSSNLTLSTTSPSLTVNDILYVDQSNDGYFVNSFGYECSNGGVRDANHAMGQWSKVTAINGSVVTIWPPLAMPIWSQSLSPNAWWIADSSWTSCVGIENLTVDGSNSTGVNGGLYQSNIEFQGTRNCWVKNVNSFNAKQAHCDVTLGMFRCEVRHCYFYGTQGAVSLSYGVVTSYGGFLLVEDNIFNHVSAPIVPGLTTVCSVFAYNYTTNNYYTAGNNFLAAGLEPHDSHTCMDLFEGNHTTYFGADFIHGSGSHHVVFRNRFTGWEAYQYPGGPTTQGLLCYNLAITNRACSSIGNLLGTATKFSNYQSVPGATLAEPVIYEIGLVNHGYNDFCSPGLAVNAGTPDDSETWHTVFRHMDYDVVNDSIAYNSTNADVTLPDSLYQTAKPAFFGGMSWPPYNPTNHTDAAMSQTNIPAGFRFTFGVETPAAPDTGGPAGATVGGGGSVGGGGRVAQ